MPEQAQPGQTTIGWMGTGVMGNSMCGHLMAAGYQAVVHTRTRAKAEGLLQKGARWADSPQELSSQCEVVFGIVGFPTDVEEVFLGRTGALAGARPGTILVDMTTSKPGLAVEIHDRAKAQGVFSLDAPVTGGDIGARNAALSILVGGEADVLEAVLPLFRCLGKTVVHQGGPGAGQNAKMVNQILISGNMMGLCEALVYASRAGLDLEKVLQSVSGGAAGSFALSTLGPRILKGDYEPGFYVEHFIKDMGIALEEGRRMNLVLPGLALAQQLYLAVQAQGMGKKGTQALILALRRMANLP
ncbi:MAG: NAD(P)-dependent oxidoreductase [Planctomycetota bacterium]|nr:NAD(P)-dependent oxidoreductase [Planctomycetota bacterium]